MTAGEPVIAVLILAAGRGTRFGSDKRAARLPDGRPLLAATIERYRTVFTDIRVVLRSDDDPATLGVPGDVSVLRAPRAGEGMGGSLADGIRAGAPADWLLVTLADMPFVAHSTVVAVADRVRTVGDAADHVGLLRPTCRGRPGHPVAFRREHHATLAASRGDAGARALLRRAPVDLLETTDPGVLADVDRPADLAGP